MMTTVRIAAVSYLNTVPFIYGIEHTEYVHASLLLSPPSGCATAFINGEADIALIPVGALHSVSGARIITPYCIGSQGPVRTVTVMSDVPVEKIKRIHLDSHSMTSALLVRILCAKLWNIAPELIDMKDYTVAENPSEGDAFLFIGDKVFDYEGRFRYCLDLAECWRRLSGLPFVFAVWVAGNNVDEETCDGLRKALKFGTEHIREAVEYYGHGGKPYACDYLTKNLDFLLDDQKRKALSLYLEEGREFR